MYRWFNIVFMKYIFLFNVKINTVMLGIAIRAMYQHAKMTASMKLKEKGKLEQLRSVLLLSHGST